MAIRFGLTIEEYWDLTPYEFSCYMKAFENKEINKINEKILLAWYVEYFAREKKLKKVTNYFIDAKKKKNKKKMTQEEIEKHYNKKVVK